MQALVPTLYPCYAAADRDTAARIAAFLERGADVRIFLDEGQIGPGETLVSKAREGRMADTVLIVFSRNSLPSRWARAEWEDALVREPVEEGVRIGFVRCDDCNPPKVLANQFDLAGAGLKALRQVKRFVRRRAANYIPPAGVECPGCEGDLEVLGIALADRPGVETAESAELAIEFARAFAEDFDEILVLETEGRSLGALVGDLGAQLGLRLEAGVFPNLERLQNFCSPRRFLLVQAGPPVQELEFGGRCSTLYTPPPIIPIQPPDRLRDAQYVLSQCHRYTDWQEVCDQARLARQIARDQFRLAECFEAMQQWNAAALEREDRMAVEESAREMVWLLEGWGLEEEARRVEYRRAAEFDEQMPLPFEF